MNYEEHFEPLSIAPAELTTNFDSFLSRAGATPAAREAGAVLFTIPPGAQIFRPDWPTATEMLKVQRFGVVKHHTFDELFLMEKHGDKSASWRDYVRGQPRREPGELSLEQLNTLIR